MLDDTGWSTSDQTLIQQYDWVNGDNQKWQFVPVDNGQYYAIQNKYSGKVLDDTAYSTQAGTTIQQYDNLGGANQQWNISDVNDPFYQIVNSQSALSLDVTGTADGTLLQQDQFTGDVNQQWRLMVDGSLPVSSSGSDPAPPSVIGISSIAYIDENHISTYSATEVDYETAAYYDSYVVTCLYQDGSQISCGSQTSSPGASAASGYLNAPSRPDLTTSFRPIIIW